MRYAIYARYSSVNQDARSIDDQVALCRARVEDAGGTVAGVYADYAISGAHIANRPQLNALLDAAGAGAFEGVMAEALDRLSRDQEHIAAIHKRLAFAGVRFETVAEGEISELHIGLKGTMNALFLKDLAAKTKRGMAGRVAAGRIPGGRSYGYRQDKAIGRDGEVERGRRSIDEPEAAVVRRIFGEYLGGRSPRDIAARLNREGVPSPRGGQWNASTINGSRSRRNGILNNELYAGRIVFNRQSFVKDPATGRRTARPNPESQWIVQEAPELRIIDETTWNAVGARRARFDRKTPRAQVRPRHLLSGLLRCGVCGAGYAVHSRARLGCSAAREKGTCDNRRTVTVAEVERRVLDGLREKMLAPELMAEFVDAYYQTLRDAKRQADRSRRRLEKDLARLTRRIRFIVEEIAEGRVTPSLREELYKAEEDKAGLEVEMRADPVEEVVEMHPDLPRRYRERVAELQDALRADEDSRIRAAEVLRSLIIAVQIRPRPGERTGVDILIEGGLANIMSLAHADEAQGTVEMVAGAGFEPATFRL